MFVWRSVFLVNFNVSELNGRMPASLVECLSVPLFVTLYSLVMEQLKVPMPMPCTNFIFMAILLILNELYHILFPYILLFLVDIYYV